MAAVSVLLLLLLLFYIYLIYFTFFRTIRNCNIIRRESLIINLNFLSRKAKIKKKEEIENAFKERLFLEGKKDEKEIKKDVNASTKLIENTPVSDLVNVIVSGVTYKVPKEFLKEAKKCLKEMLN